MFTPNVLSKSCNIRQNISCIIFLLFNYVVREQADRFAAVAYVSTSFHRFTWSLRFSYTYILCGGDHVDPAIQCVYKINKSIARSVILRYFFVLFGYHGEIKKRYNQRRVFVCRIF